MTSSDCQIAPLLRSGMTITDLVKHYTQHELPRLAYSTGAAYKSCLKNWIVPKWGNHNLAEVKAVAVEAWLASLPLANGSKSKVRNVMCSLYSHACRWE